MTVELNGYIAGTTGLSSIQEQAAAAMVKGKKKARVVIFGSSPDAHNHVVLPCDITVASGVATVTSTDTTPQHLIGTGATVFLGKPDPANSFEDNQYVGTFTRTSSTAGTVPVPGWPDGTGTTKMHLMSAYAPPSWYRQLNNKLNGALELVAPFGLAGEVTSRKVLEFDRVLEFAPDIIMGAWGIGNDVLQGTTSTTVANMTQMLDKAIAKGIYCVVVLPPAVPALTTAQAVEGARIVDQLTKDYAGSGLVYFVDEAPLTVDPMTGQGQAALFKADGVHANHRYAVIKGDAVYNVVSAIVGQTYDPRIMSIYDSYISNTGSKQLMEGFWATSGGTTIAASTIETGAAGKVSGTCHRSFTKITTTGNASRAAVFSLVSRSDGVGYDQQVVFTAAAANDALYIELTGHAGLEFWRNIQTNQTYRPSCSLNITLGTATLSGYEHYISATVGGNNVRVSENMRTTNADVDTTVVTNFTEDVCTFPKFSVGTAPTDAKWVIQIQAATAGTFTLKLGRPTLRMDQ